MSTFHKLIACVALIFAFAVATAQADEGMWPLYALDNLDFAMLKARGLELGPDQIYNPQDGGISAAVVQVGGGSGSFVSPDGLIVTNHHVAFGAVQNQSSVDRNLLKNGFLAKTMADEIPAVGYNAYVTKSFKDVTSDVRRGVNPGMSDLERYETLEKNKKLIIKKAEKNGDVKCRIAAVFGGKEYYLITMFRIRDIRIVQIPHLSIGEFGGDIDNWMWPRHCGDFSFLRAYVAPDGSSAEFAEENVPYKSDRYPPISSGHLAEGDFAMIIGYPGRTARYRSSFSIDESINHSYPRTIERFGDLIGIMEEISVEDPVAAIKLSGRIKGFNNYLKNSKGMLKGLVKSGLLAKKRAQEQELSNFIVADPALTEKYGTVLAELKANHDEQLKFDEKESVLGGLSMVSRLYSTARGLYKWSIEKTKKDLDREPRYMERNVEDRKRSLERMQLTYVPEAEQRMLEYMTLRALRLPADQRIAGIDKQFYIAAREDTAQAVTNFVMRIIDGTRLDEVKTRLAMFDMSTEELLKTNDPFIKLARDLYDETEELNERSKAASGALAELRPKLVEVYARWRQGNYYPDANGTIRLSYGEVKGYSPADAVSYKYVTTLSGVLEKETGIPPFNSPAKLLEVYRSDDFGNYVDSAIGDVPVDFLTTNDGTGGNSGSPIINGKGELIGLDFDTNWEGVVGDYYFDPVVKRSICVDARYMLFILDKVYGAQNVLDELTIH